MDLLHRLINVFLPIIIAQENPSSKDNSSLLTLVATLAGIAIGSFSSFMATWLTLRNQLSMQRVEIVAQRELKARELLFNSYQKKLEVSLKVLGETGEGLGKLEPILNEL